MRLSKKAQYGTRAMLELALSFELGFISLSHIAREQGISVKYLEHLMRQLKKADMVQSLRGAAGGYRLSRPPSEIRVGEIIRALEEPMNPVECLDNSEICDRSEKCRARSIWIYLSSAIQRTLDGITLKEILLHHED
jgi:Rrf2 family protein